LPKLEQEIRVSAGVLGAFTSKEELLEALSPQGISGESDPGWRQLVQTACNEEFSNR